MRIDILTTDIRTGNTSPVMVSMMHQTDSLLLREEMAIQLLLLRIQLRILNQQAIPLIGSWAKRLLRSEEHTSELQSRGHLVCRLLLEKKKKNMDTIAI